MKKRLVISILILVASSNFLYSQINTDNCEDYREVRGDYTIVYTLCDSLLTDTLFEYDQKGRLSSIYDYGKNNMSGIVKYTWYNHKFFETLKKTTGTFNLDGDKIGEWKYFKKNGKLWDYEVYENGTRKTWIRYKNNGEIIWERKY